MSNTYAQLHIQFIFAVKYRAASIHPSWKERLHKYTTMILQNNQHKLIRINSMPDHIHILIGMHPHQSVSSIVQIVKTETGKWINEQKLTRTQFRWQGGYGAFSYSKSQLPNIINYIQNQEAHHQRKSFIQEYKEFLDAFDIKYDNQYIFKELE